MSCRSLAEYRAFFDLDLGQLAGRRVLDCSAGASSFAAEASAAGADVTAADPIYALDPSELADVARRGLETGSTIADEHPGRFTWSWYGDRLARDVMRRGALSRFLLDFATHRDRYVAAALPSLPFGDREFDVALCSHFLFTWAEDFGLDWHRAALRELCRVAPEVRVFPLVRQGAGGAVPFWDALVASLDSCTSEVREVPYEFQVGANKMLVLRG